MNDMVSLNLHFCICKMEEEISFSTFVLFAVLRLLASNIYVFYFILFFYYFLI